MLYHFGMRPNVNKKNTVSKTFMQLFNYYLICSRFTNVLKYKKNQYNKNKIIRKQLYTSQNQKLNKNNKRSTGITTVLSYEQVERL